MKQLIWLMLLVVPFTAQSQNAHDGIQWEQNLTWEQIKQKARQENKFIFVDAYATWCVPCKKMDKDVYTEKTVGDSLNIHFISLKIQMDKTENDNEQIRSWYNVADTISKAYGVSAFPTFLFFSPNGNLTYKDIGLQSSESFLSMAKEALRDPFGQYKNQVEKFAKGKLEYESMPALARLAKQKKDEELAHKIAMEYRVKYLDSLSDKEVFKKDNLLFLADFPQIINSNDRYFKYFKMHPNIADKEINYVIGGRLDKISRRVVLDIIRREEIVRTIYRDSKPILDPKPNWKQIHASINEKYGSGYVQYFFPDEQINYYRQINDWNNFAKYVNRKVDKLDPNAGGYSFKGQLSDAFYMNAYAWDIFENCDDKKVLKKAFKWANMAIELRVQASKDSSVVLPEMDTKANLLYRLGRKKEAIALEKTVVELTTAKRDQEMFAKTLEKMENDLPTWNSSDKGKGQKH